MCRKDLARMVSPGSENRANAREDHPGTWEVLLPPCLRKPGGDRWNNSRPVSRSARKRTGANGMGAGNKWYRQAKETKRGETGSKKS